MTEGPDGDLAEVWRQQVEDSLRMRYYLSGEAHDYPPLGQRQRIKAVLWHLRWRLAHWILPRDVRYLLSDDD